MEKGMEKLQALLSAEGRELVNIKFFPGSGRGATPDSLAGAACELLVVVDFDNLVDNPPFSGLRRTSL